MAQSTAVTTLKYSTDGITYNKLVDILNYPDLGSPPSKLDTTDLTQPKYKTNIFGLIEAPDLTFECNYDEAKLQLIASLTALNYYFRLEFGSTDGKFDWQGVPSAFAMGAGVDEVRKMTVITSVSTAIAFTTT